MAGLAQFNIGSQPVGVEEGVEEPQNFSILDSIAQAGQAITTGVQQFQLGEKTKSLTDFQSEMEDLYQMRDSGSINNNQYNVKAKQTFESFRRQNPDLSSELRATASEYGITNFELADKRDISDLQYEQWFTNNPLQVELARNKALDPDTGVVNEEEMNDILRANYSQDLVEQANIRQKQNGQRSLSGAKSKPMTSQEVILDPEVTEQLNKRMKRELAGVTSVLSQGVGNIPDFVEFSANAKNTILSSKLRALQFVNDAGLNLTMDEFSELFPRYDNLLNSIDSYIDVIKDISDERDAVGNALTMISLSEQDPRLGTKAGVKAYTESVLASAEGSLMIDRMVHSDGSLTEDGALILKDLSNNPVRNPDVSNLNEGFEKRVDPDTGEVINDAPKLNGNESDILSDELNSYLESNNLTPDVARENGVNNIKGIKPELLQQGKMVDEYHRSMVSFAAGFLKSTGKVVSQENVNIVTDQRKFDAFKQYATPEQLEDVSILLQKVNEKDIANKISTYNDTRFNKEYGKDSVRLKMEKGDILVAEVNVDSLIKSNTPAANDIKNKALESMGYSSQDRFRKPTPYLVNKYGNRFTDIPEYQQQELRSDLERLSTEELTESEAREIYRRISLNMELSKNVTKQVFDDIRDTITTDVYYSPFPSSGEEEFKNRVEGFLREDLYDNKTYTKNIRSANRQIQFLKRNLNEKTWSTYREELGRTHFGENPEPEVVDIPLGDNREEFNTSIQGNNTIPSISLDATKSEAINTVAENQNPEVTKSVFSIAQGYIGMSENDRKAKPVIQGWFDATGVSADVETKDGAWCAAFVNHVLNEAGLASAESAKAWSQSYKKIGKAVNQNNLQRGDVVVFDYGNGRGHVGFFAGYADNGKIKVLGGNQRRGFEGSDATGGAVTISEYNTDNIVSYRRPVPLNEESSETIRELSVVMNQSSNISNSRPTPPQSGNITVTSLPPANNQQDTEELPQQEEIEVDNNGVNVVNTYENMGEAFLDNDNLEVGNTVEVNNRLYEVAEALNEKYFKPLGDKQSNQEQQGE